MKYVAELDRQRREEESKAMENPYADMCLLTIYIKPCTKIYRRQNDFVEQPKADRPTCISVR